MYLTDAEIRERLSQLDFQCENGQHGFDPDVQIQPCSVDLRLDNVFWNPRRNIRAIDLRKSKLLDLSPRRYYIETALKESEYITIKPGELVLGRVYEKFTIPNDCAGKLEGRSSTSRLGLGIHISGDFINPAWSGHMPLQLVNYSRVTIKIFPFIPICQLMLIKLAKTPERLYGVTELQSKYMQDDGGPSYWWRDKRIRSLQTTFHQKDIALDIQENILTAIGVSDPDIIQRFETFATGLNRDDISNSTALLRKFAERELWKKRIEEFFIRGSQVIFILITGNSLRLIFWEGAITTPAIIFYVLNFLIFAVFLYSFIYERKQFFTADTLER
jgi:deoxycytidine triphosphate deaminase